MNDSATIHEFRLKSVTNPMGQEFLKTVSNYFKQITQHTTSIKYVLLLGHDSSIMSVMNTMEHPLDQIPGYASRLNFSLINDRNQYYVKISYNDKPVSLSTCNGNICTSDQFNKFINEFY